MASRKAKLIILFMRCPGCGVWFDMRDLGEVFEHIHDGPIKERRYHRDA